MTDLANPSDEELMAAYAAGDQAAFRPIFDRYAPILYRMLERQIGAEDAGDLVQQTFLHLHRARRDFRTGSRLKPWLFTIAMNVKRDHFRYRARRPQVPLDAVPQAPAREADPLDRKERALAVRSALAALPAPQREVIALHWFEGLSFKEIASLVGARLSAVKVRAHRGYKELRRRLESEKM